VKGSRLGKRSAAAFALAALLGILVFVVLASRPPGAAKPSQVEAARPDSAEAAAPLVRPIQKPSVGVLPTSRQVANADAFARGREGLVSFAFVDTNGKLYCHDCRRRHVSASLVKAMLLLAYLERLSAGHRPLTASDRALLGAMIRLSDNNAADVVYARVGDAGLDGVARRVGMQRFDVHGYWANAQLTAADQALLFARLGELVPPADRTYVRRLLSSIVHRQSWGVPQAARPRWRTYFKGGWRGTSRGQLVHQAARLERDRLSVAIAVLTDGNPSHDYGVATVRGIAERLLGVKAASPRRARPVRPNGRLLVVGGSSEVTGAGSLKRFTVEVEDGLAVDHHAFASFVEATLSEERGWAGRDDVAFQRVSQEPVSFRVILASPVTTDRLCAPLRTNGFFSCFMQGRAVLNVRRWRAGASAYGRALAAYRRYMVNHEVGHALGYEHTGCSGTGHRAPVMMQQTKGVAPCRPNARPLPEERR
jgi:beta-lactamase class A